MSRRRTTGGGGRQDRRLRPAELRERADEMAALLDEAAPRARRTRRRRSLAVPAAVAAFGALSVGGVGLALGLTPTGTEGQLPASPSPALADPASPLLPATSDATVEPTAAELDPAVAGADLIRPDDRTRAGIAARPSSDRAPAPTTTSGSTTTTTTRSARPTRTKPRPTTTPRPTVTRSATPRSTAPAPDDDDRPTSTATARPVAERSALPTTTDPGPAPSALTADESPEPSESSDE